MLDQFLTNSKRVFTNLQVFNLVKGSKFVRKPEHMKRNIISLLFTLLPLLSFTQVALNLDGTDDYVNTLIADNQNNFPNSTFTLECWAKSSSMPNTSSGFSGPIYGGVMGIYWNHQNGQFTGAGSVADQNGAFTPCSFGQLFGNTWYHLAISYDGSILKSYVNGVMINSVQTGGGLSSGLAATIFLGKHISISNFFNGNIDEVRIWNIARSATEINDNYLISINTPQTGLLASYTFEEGIPNGNNTNLTQVSDYSGNNHHGVLNSFNLTGTNSNYVGSLSNLSGLQDAALNFNGSNTAISTPLSLSNTGFPGITMECWVKSPSAPTGGIFDGPMYADNMAIIWNHGSAGYRGAASIQAANGQFFAASFGTLSANTWYHLALTYDGTSLKAYKNGTLVTSTATSGGLYNNGNTLVLGRHPGQNYFFNGTVDAVRVWNVARSCYQINSTINSEINTTTPGLQLSYNFNDRYPEGQNTGTTVTDNSGNNRNGTLQNFALMGPTANYVYEAPFNAPTVAPTFNAQPQDVSSCNGSPVTIQALINGGNFGFQWQVDAGGGFVNLVNSSDYSGVFSMILNITNPSIAMNNYNYRCAITSLAPQCVGTAYSDTATLTIANSPTVSIMGMGTVCQGSSVTLTASGADSYLWSLPIPGNDQASITFGAGGQVDVTVTGTTNGCSSTATYTQMVNPSYSVSENVFICQGQTHTYPDGTTGNVSETHTSSFTNIHGCDSLIVTNLTVQQPYTETRNVSICSGQSYQFPDMTFAQGSGTNVSVLSSVAGCDSTIITNLTVQPAYNYSVNATICQGQTFQFPDGTFGNTAQTQVSYLQTQFGCDSIITTVLSVNSGFFSQQSTPICHGETFTFLNGETYTANDFSTYTHYSIFTAANGCDSTYQETLFVNPESSSSETIVVCFGQTYTFPDGTLGSTSGSHTSILDNVFGCDSLIFTFLTVQDPVISSPVLNGNTLSVTSNGSVQWFECIGNNDPIPGATGNTFTPDHSGSYGAIGTDGNCTMTTECVTVNLVALSEMEFQDFQLYPNPTSDEIYFISKNDENYYIEIINSFGQVVQKTKSQQNLTISLRDLPSGVYTFKISDSKILKVRQIVKL